MNKRPRLFYFDVLQPSPGIECVTGCEQNFREELERADEVRSAHGMLSGGDADGKTWPEELKNRKKPFMDHHNKLRNLLLSCSNTAAAASH